MTVTDASVWVSRFLPDDEFHEISRAWLKALWVQDHLSLRLRMYWLK